MSWWKNCTEESVEPEVKLGVEKANVAHRQATDDIERLHKMETDGEILRFIAQQLIIIKQMLSSK